MVVVIHASDASHGSMLSRAKSVVSTNQGVSFPFFLLIFDKLEKHQGFPRDSNAKLKLMGTCKKLKLMGTPGFKKKKKKKRIL